MTGTVNPRTDTVLVVGAGPVGLTAACQLARLGVPVRVVEALDRPTTESRAVAVQARSMEMLAALGVLSRLEPRGRRIDAMDVLDGRSGRQRARVDFTGVASRHPYMLDVAQPDTEAVLAQRADELGIEVRRGVALTALTQDADGVEVTLTGSGGERTERVGWVVGADGGHSTTRHLVGTRLEGGFHGQHFAMADVDVETSFPPDSVRTFLHPDGLGMLFPMAGSRARLMFYVEAPAADAQPTLAQIQALADARTGGRVVARDPHWLAYFEIHHAQVPRYRHGRVLLAGDAAHVHSPAGGQGMNTGMQDATNLAWKLALVARGRAGEELLDTYDTERHPIGAAVVRSTTVMTDVAAAAGTEAVVRSLALAVLGHAHRITDTLSSRVAEVALHHRDSPLSRHHGAHHRGAARAGDHAPDPAGLRRADGTPVAVEELLTRPGLLLLVRTGDPAAIDALRRVLGDLGAVVRVVGTAGDDRGECVTDPDDVVGRHYGLGREGLALIRPDGYLGLVADSADPGLVRAYLDEVLRIARLAAV